MSRMIRTVLAALAIAAVAAPGAIAAPNGKISHIRVSYADLNLESEAGAQTMLGRLKAASTRACGGLVGGLAWDLRKMQRRCTAEAMANAVEQLDAPTVTAMFRNEGGMKFAAR